MALFRKAHFLKIDTVSLWKAGFSKGAAIRKSLGTLALISFIQSNTNVDHSQSRKHMELRLFFLWKSNYLSEIDRFSKCSKIQQ